MGEDQTNLFTYVSVGISKAIRYVFNGLKMFEIKVVEKNGTNILYAVHHPPEPSIFKADNIVRLIVVITL
jgi:hypothetical protein